MYIFFTMLVLVSSGRPIFVSWAVPKHKYVQEEHKVKQDVKVDSAPSQDFEEGMYVFVIIIMLCLVPYFYGLPT